MKNSNYFINEIEYIQNDLLKNIVIDVLDNSPECIVHIPASSSGKYHPKYSLGEGGLMRHIIASVGIANSLIKTDIFKNIVFGINEKDTFDYFGISKIYDIYSDIAYVSLILHDCCKPDNTVNHNTKFEHPIIAADLFYKIAENYKNESNKEYLNQITPIIYNCIASHMGEWNVSKYKKDVVLPKPKNGIEQFVHLCDYLASRKFLIFDFDIYNELR